MRASTSRGSWHSATFMQEYDEPPIVIAGIPTYAGGHEMVVSIRDITTTGFKWFFHEPTCYDDSHTTESFSYLAATEGTHNLEGLNIIFGKTTSTTSWSTVTHNGGVGNGGVLLAQVQNAVNNDYWFVNTRHRNVGSNSFDVKLDPHNKGSTFSSLSVGYMVVESVAQDIGGGRIAANIMANVNHQTHKAWLNPSSTSWSVDSSDGMVAWFGQVITYNDADHATLRLVNGKKNYMQFFVDEECGGNHGNEDVAYFAITEGILEDVGGTKWVIDGSCASNGLSTLSRDECDDIAAKMGATGGRAYTSNCSGSSCPKGCYQFHSTNSNNHRLYWNDNQNGNCDWSTRQCLCK